MTTNLKQIKQRGEIEFIRLASIQVPPWAQRKLRPHRVDELVSQFALDDFGTPVVSERRGIFYVVDGQHRIEAIKRWLGDGWEDQRIECRVLRGLSERDEADTFDRLNDTLNVDAFDKFRIRVNAGREVETRIQHVVEREQLKISRDQVPGRIMAVGTLRRVFVRSNEATLGKALRIIRDGYGDAGFESMVIDGIGHLVQRYNGLVDEKVAAKQLGGIHGGVKGLLNRASVIHERMGGPKAHSVAAAAVDAINAHQGRGKKLPSWWKTSSDEGVAVTVD